jgi:peptidoglycan/xylan/chitin deacetylase (PgdA/CDA1 family)
VTASELHVFVLWSRARDREEEILADLSTQFAVLELFEAAWTRSRFSDNLTRLYGEALPAGSNKEVHCGTGPLLVAVVRDDDPRHEYRSDVRRTALVNANTFDAKQRYRRWTGGGHRVHASLTEREAERDLFLLLGRRADSYDGMAAATDPPRRPAGDPVGADGWPARDHLLSALELSLSHCRVLAEADDTLELEVSDAWWAAIIANGKPGIAEPTAPRHEVDVGGRPVRLDLREGALRPPAPRRTPAAAQMLETVARLRDVGVALCFHRVAETPGDRDRELVPAFALTDLHELASLLAARYAPVAASALATVVAGRRRGSKLPVAVTFDDDLASHAELVAPVLERHGIPATFFLTGATLDGPAPFWWEDLQALVDSGRLGAGDVPELPAVDVEQALRREPRAIHALARRIESMSREERSVLAARLRSLRGSDALEPGLSREAVRRLAADGFEIGFHTLGHHRLTELDGRALTAAMADGRDRLAAAAARPLRALAYPHGIADERVAAAARAAGFEAGFTGGSRPVLRTSDALLLPRYELRSGPRRAALSLPRAALGRLG